MLSIHRTHLFDAVPPGPSSDVRSPTSTATEVRSPTSTATEVRSPTSTSTEVRSPTSTSTEVRSPTSTSTDAYTQGNITVTGGAGAGATNVTIYTLPAPQPKRADEQAHLMRSNGAAWRMPAMMQATGAPRPGMLMPAIMQATSSPRPPSPIPGMMRLTNAPRATQPIPGMMQSVSTPRAPSPMPSMMQKAPSMALGYIPSWQFSTDAKTNPALNPFVTYPEGVYQTTTQPIGPYYQTGANMSSNMSGHRLSFGDAAPSTTVVDQTNAMFESWWWKNRKPLVVGGVALVGLSLAAALAAILK